jgi:hypothetical protein
MNLAYFELLSSSFQMPKTQNMNRDELRAYLAAQIEEIQKFKWLESERLHQDIGFHQAATEWINRYSAEFRQHWNESQMNQSRLKR